MLKTNDEIDRREALLRRVAASAGALAEDAFRNRRPGDFTLKGRQDFLTEADAAVEAHIRAKIAAAFPGDGILGEEGGGTAAPSLWVVDPIDGTANFARGIAHFCISIAWCNHGRPVLGAIFNPVTAEFYFARHGHGAEKNGRPLAIAATSTPESASIELGWSARIPDDTYLATIAALLSQGFSLRRGASGALALAWVAEGRIDGYAELHMNAWDCLAGLLLVKEAGGATGLFPVSEVELLAGGPVLAAAPGIADRLSAATGIALGSAAPEALIKAAAE